MQAPGNEVDSVTALPTNALEKQLDDELICMCGTLRAQADRRVPELLDVGRRTP